MAGLPVTDGENTTPPLVPQIDDSTADESPDGDRESPDGDSESPDGDQEQYLAGIVTPASNVSF